MMLQTWGQEVSPYCETEAGRFSRATAASASASASAAASIAAAEDSGLGLELATSSHATGDDTRHLQELHVLSSRHRRRPCRGLAFTAVFSYEPSLAAGEPAPQPQQQVSLAAEDRLLAIDCVELRPEWLRVRRLRDGAEGFAPAAFLLCEADGLPAFQRCWDCGCGRRRAPAQLHHLQRARRGLQRRSTMTATGDADEEAAAAARCPDHDGRKVQQFDCAGGAAQLSCGYIFRGRGQLSESIRWTAF